MCGSTVVYVHGSTVGYTLISPVKVTEAQKCHLIMHGGD